MRILVPTLAAEKLSALHGLDLCVETRRQWQRAPKLSHTVALDCAFAVDPEDTVFVTEKCPRFAMGFEIFARRLEVVES